MIVKREINREYEAEFFRMRLTVPWEILSGSVKDYGSRCCNLNGALSAENG